ncbi:MAG: hypothetical protein O3C40_02610 [Planctomycetota bacterium]|nr:hypothetical protein [Planctomycetota bacterium]
MFRRLLCLLLVALMLASQGLRPAHSHRGADFAEPEGHDSRSHFHVGGHTHHHSQHHSAQGSDHSQGDHAPRVPPFDAHDATLVRSLLPAGDHDASAVYRAETETFARDGNSVRVLAENVAPSAILRVANRSDGLLRLGPLRGPPASIFDGACPIYLRTLSLRI